MVLNISENWRKSIIPATSILIFGSLSIYSAIIGMTILLYPAISAVLASIIFLTSQHTTSIEECSPNINPLGKLLDIYSFVIISYLSLVSPSHGGSLDNITLFLLFSVGVIIAYRVTNGSRIALLQIPLLAVLITSQIWFSFPIFGKDNPFHVAFIGHIYRTGKIIPVTVPSRGYYHWYPIAHIGSAITGVIADIPVRTAYFIFVGVPSCFVGLFSYLWFSSTNPSVKHGKYAGLLSSYVVTLSAFSLARIANLYAQTLGLVLSAIVFYLLLRSRSNRHVYLSVIVLTSLLLTHNLPILVVGGFSTIFIIIAKLYSIAFKSRVTFKTPPVSIVFSVIVATLYYYIAIGYLMQFRRIVDIFLIRSGMTAELADKNTGQSGMTTVFDFHTILVGDLTILFYSLPLLTLIFIVGFGLHQVTWDIQRQRFSSFPHVYILTSGLFFVAFIVAMYLGENSSHVSRALDLAVLFVGPVIGLAFSSWGIKSKLGRGTITILFAILLISSLIYPGLMIPNRTGMFQPTLSQESASAADFAYEYTNGVSTDSYTATTTALSREIGVKNPNDTGIGTTNKISPKFAAANRSALRPVYKNANKTDLILLREYILEWNGLKQDFFSKADTIYHNGDARIISKN